MMQCVSANDKMAWGCWSRDVMWPPGDRRMPRPFKAWARACSGRSANINQTGSEHITHEDDLHDGSPVISAV